MGACPKHYSNHFAVFGIGLGILFSCTKSFERAVEADIKAVAHLDVEIADLKFHPFSGYIEVLGLLIKNPEPFKNDDKHFFLKAGLIRLDIGMWKLIKSRGKDIHIDEVTAAGMEVIIEYSGYFGGKSNVHAIMEKMSDNEKGAKPADDEKPAKTDATANQEGDKARTNVILHKVCFEDIGMKLETKLTGAHVSAGDINYKDFAEEVGSSVVDDIIYELLKSLGKTLLEHMAGQNFANLFAKSMTFDNT